MENYFYLKFSNIELFKCKLLLDVAPKTCEAFVKALPFTCGSLAASFSGHVGYLNKDFDFKDIENPIVFGAKPGDIFLNTNVNNYMFEGKIVPPQIFFAYGTAVVLWNWTGFLPSNHFARIVEGNLQNLWLVGKRLRWEGKQDVECTFIS